MSLETLVQAWRLGYADGRESVLEHCTCHIDEGRGNVLVLDEYRKPSEIRNGTN